MAFSRPVARTSATDDSGSRRGRRRARAATVVAAVALLAGCGGGGDDATIEPTEITGSELMVRGFDNTTAEEQAGLCDGVQLMGAQFVVESLLSEEDVPADIADADPEVLATALEEFCAALPPADQ